MIVNYTGSREEKKTTRANRVARIVVTVMRGETALYFDGDEISQVRLDRFSRRMRGKNRQTIPWVMADNSVIEVTADEMEEALDLAMKEQGDVWFID